MLGISACSGTGMHSMYSPLIQSPDQSGAKKKKTQTT